MTRESLEILKDVPLAPLTTLGVGGQARFLVNAHSVGEVEQALQFAKEDELDVFVLGGGSNVVVSDRGFDGLVLRIAVCGIDERSPKAGANDSDRVGTTEKASEPVTL